MDELCVSKRRNLWLWTAVSRYSGQILALVLGDRTWENVARLWSKVPEAWRRRLVYTDGYGAYPSFFSSWQHRLCEKFDGGTTTGHEHRRGGEEGVNQSLGHRCGALVRRTSARCRSQQMWDKRVQITVAAHNRAGERRLKRRTKTMRLKR